MDFGLSGADEKVFLVRGNESSPRVQLRSITSIMEELGHTHIDILKIDIEGSEWDFFPPFFETTFPVCQLIVEIHWFNFELAVETMEKIRRKGFKMHYKEPNFLFFPNLIEFAWVNDPLYFETEPA